jgi:hypothetical protein
MKKMMILVGGLILVFSICSWSALGWCDPALGETWKELKKLEIEARRIVVGHVETLAKNPKFEQEIVIIHKFPPIRFKCLLWPWLLQCRWDKCRMFPWLCWDCLWCPVPCRYCPPPPPDWYQVDPIVPIDAIMHHLPVLEPAKITEQAVLEASIAVMEEKIKVITQSTDRVLESLKRFK